MILSCFGGLSEEGFKQFTDSLDHFVEPAGHGIKPFSDF